MYANDSLTQSPDSSQNSHTSKIKITPCPSHLTSLAADALRGEVTLETDTGWFDYAELYVYHYAGKYDATLIIYTEGVTYPATLYEPEETVWLEDRETAEFIKIRELDEWCKRHGFDISTARRV